MLKLRNIFEKIVKSKLTIIIIGLAFLAVSFYLVRDLFFIKGETKSPNRVVLWIDSAHYNLISNSQDRNTILAENKIVVYPEDIITEELILDPVLDKGAGQKIIVKRAPVFHVEADGKVVDVRSWDPLTENLIALAGFKLGPKDLVSSSLKEKVTSGATIVITRINEVDTEEIVEVPFATVRIGDASIPFGQEKVTRNGVTGKIKNLIRVTYKNGVEVSRKLIGKEVLTAKVDKQIAGGIITGQSNYGNIYHGLTTSFYKSGYRGKYLLVTNLENRKQVRVKIVDVGPTNGPILDLGIDAFLLIGGQEWHGHIDSVSVQLVE